MANAIGKVILVAISLLVFSALAGTVVTNLAGVNVTAFTILTDMPGLVAVIFFLGAGVILVAKETGIL